MAHRDILAKLSDNVCTINPNPQLSWNFPPKSRPNLVPRSSSKAEIQLITLVRPAFKLPPLSHGSSQSRSFVLSSPSASFNKVIVDDTIFSDSPVVI